MRNEQDCIGFTHSHLIGCASAPFPEGVPTALIRFTADAPVIIVPMCERDAFIRQGLLHNPYLKEVSPVKMYGTRTDKTNEVVERLVPADRTLMFRVRWGHFGANVSEGKGELTQCDRLFAIGPKPGEQYQADYRLGRGACTLTAYRLNEAGGGSIQKTELPVRFYEAGEDTSGVCGPQGRRRVL